MGSVANREGVLILPRFDVMPSILLQFKLGLELADTLAVFWYVAYNGNSPSCNNPCL